MSLTALTGNNSATSGLPALKTVADTRGQAAIRPPALTYQYSNEPTSPTTLPIDSPISNANGIFQQNQAPALFSTSSAAIPVQQQQQAQPTPIQNRSNSNKPVSSSTRRTPSKDQQKLATQQRSNTRASSTSSISSQPNGSKANWVIHKDWKLKRMLGSGAYGEVYQATELRTGSKVAIKMDMRNNSEMEREIEYLKRLNGQSEYIPQILEYGRFSGISYFVMTLLGKNLSDLKRKRMNRKFTLSTVIRCMRQMVMGLRDIHNMGLIHRDIKPANFSIGRINKKKVYIFDFGLASEFNTGPEKPTVGFRGTNTYASIRVHQYKDPGRVDDLWSLLYCVLRLLGMKFPWDKVKIPPKAERCNSKEIRDMYIKLQKDTGDNRIPSKNTMVQKLKQERKRIQEEFLEVKKKADINHLLEDAEKKYNLPADAFKKIVSHLDTLSYKCKPDYQLIDDILVGCMTRLGINMDDTYDWEETSFF